MGRPKALDAGLMFEICERIADGETVRQIAADEHMPCARTIYLTLANDTEFSQQYARAREAQLERWEDELLEIADDASNDYVERLGKDGKTFQAVDHDHVTRSRLRIDARKWLMAKRMPKKYGDRVEHEVNQTVRDITDEPVSADDWAERHVTPH
jgi:hypothetical protein